MMRRRAAIALTALTLAAGATAGAQSVERTQTVPAGSARGAATVAAPQETTAELEAAEAELRASSDALKEGQLRVAAGFAPSSQISPLEARARRASAQVEMARSRQAAQAQRAQASTRVAALQRPISVDLQDSPVRQAALTISQATGLTIHVQERVPTDTRLTVVARGVPLATVLDTIARQTGLLIAPYGNGSDVELQPAPSLPANGERPDVGSPFAPWTRQWGMNPASGIALSGRPGTAGEWQRTPGMVGAPPGFSATPPPLGLPEAPAGAPGYSLDRTTGIAPLSITGLSGSSFVIAQPAPGGEPALLLTLYRLDGGQLRAVSSIVHHLGSSPRSAGGGVSVPGPEEGAPHDAGGEVTPAPVAP